jgi:hypothetical protein
MKKILLFLMSVIMFTACSGCGQSQENATTTDSTAVAAKDSTIVIDVDHAIAIDRQTMYAKYKDSYRWYETEILLPEFLDAENVTSNPEMVVNVLQSIVEEGNGADVWVHKFQHFKDGTVVHDSIQGFWIEDFALNDEAIKLNYTAAYDRMMQSNFPKPHSRYVTLRNPIGPVAINTQWIFGNINEQIWVDAVTGECANSNPAYPKEKGFKMPLGEWP